jgi:hypothetical protein
MSNQIFKEQDRVYHFLYGWGEVVKLLSNNNQSWVRVQFDKQEKGFEDNFRDGFLLSFTEYTLEGFSQERPEPLPKLGDIVWGKGFHTTDWSIGHYLGKQHASYKISSTPNAESYWLANKITTINPYTNEK